MLDTRKRVGHLHLCMYTPLTIAEVLHRSFRCLLGREVRREASSRLAISALQLESQEFCLEACLLEHGCDKHIGAAEKYGQLLE
jgi:hypothetical protein